MEKDKLIKFIRAVESDPGHAAFLLGLRRNAALQYHGVNVSIIGSMTDESFLTEAVKLYPKEFAEVKRVAEQCEQLAEVMGKDAITLQAIDLFRSVAVVAEVAQPAQGTETVAEAGMMVKCPGCGKEFAVKQPAEGRA